MKTIIAGSRDVPNDAESYAEICKAMADFGEDVTEVVSGCSRGVDKLGEQWANVRSIPVKPFPYESKYGKAGGPIRNRKMAEYADALVAIWDGESKGTKNMIDEANKRGLLVYVYRV